jgi:hypothetical protein
VASLILKRAKFSRPDGQRKDEDYDVLADGKVVGRIYEVAGSRFDPPELRWFWSITVIVPATPGVTNGTAATREQAMAKFRAAWEKAGGKVSPLRSDVGLSKKRLVAVALICE